MTLAAQDAAPAARTAASSALGSGYGSYWLDSGDTVLSTGQTSMVVDPPSGRAPSSSGPWTRRHGASSTKATTTAT